MITTDAFHYSPVHAVMAAEASQLGHDFNAESYLEVKSQYTNNVMGFLLNTVVYDPDNSVARWEYIPAPIESNPPHNVVKLVVFND